MKRLELMQRSKVSRSGSNRAREPFITLDDLLEKAQDLFDGLKRLSEYRHPLEIRRGVRKEVDRIMAEDRQSRQIKAGGRTYFFDIGKTKEDKPYLRITESRKGQGDKWERNSINIFPESAVEFTDAVSEMAKKLT